MFVVKAALQNLCFPGFFTDSSPTLLQDCLDLSGSQAVWLSWSSAQSSLTAVSVWWSCSDLQPSRTSTFESLPLGCVAQEEHGGWRRSGDLEMDWTSLRMNCRKRSRKSKKGNNRRSNSRRTEKRGQMRSLERTQVSQVDPWLYTLGGLELVFVLEPAMDCLTGWHLGPVLPSKCSTDQPEDRINIDNLLLDWKFYNTVLVVFIVTFVARMPDLCNPLFFNY